MTRHAIDCTGGNAGWVRASMPLPDIMFWYGTGSPSVAWSDSERSLFPASIMCEIDQGGAGSPILSAVVRDVERGAWAPGQAVNRMGWNVPRPTIYCSRGELPSVIADGWEGDIWLAWPGWTGEPLPSHPGCTIVAVQDVFAAEYDHSTVLDPTWPRLGKVPLPANTLSVTVISRNADIAWGEMPGADHYVIQYESPTMPSPVVIMRSLAMLSGGATHLKDVIIPESHGGTITVHGIVDAAAITVGSRNLP